MSQLSILENILLFTFLGSTCALIGGVLLLSKEKLALKISHFLASFSAGVLLGTAFFDLLPEASHAAETLEVNIFLWTLIGILLFFLIERFIHWFHHHDDYHEHHRGQETKTTLPLIIISDTLHNFLDGIVIAATFMASGPLGVVTSLAVFAHELPQEIGDFGLMLHKGMKRKKIILVNLLSAAASFAGALLTYVIGSSLEKNIPVFLSVTAGFFIYIALSDIIPEIHQEGRRRHAMLQTALFICGIIIIYFSSNLLGHSH